MNTTITLTPENAAEFNWVVEALGLPLEEVINNVLNDSRLSFGPDEEELEHVFGNWKYRDRASAERALTWIELHTRDARNKDNTFVGKITRTTGGRYKIDAFETNLNGKLERVC